MARRERPGGRALAVGVSVAVHLGLFGTWLAQRPAPSPPDPPPVEVLLVRPPPREPLAPETPPLTQTAAERPPAASAIRPRPVPQATAAPLPSPAASGPTSAVAAPLAPAGPSLDSRTRSALAARLNCRDPQDAEAREHCAQRIAAAPGVALPETRPYFRMREHVAVMAEVRRKENTGYRASCEAMRNLNPECPNRLPDNKPEDFELPRD